MHIIRLFKKVFSILDKRQQRNFFFLLMIMLIAGFLEALGISLFVPVLYVLLDGNMFTENPVIIAICSRLGIVTQNQFIITSFVFIGIIYILKNIYLYFQVKAQNNYVYNNRARFFISIYEIYLNKDYLYFVNNKSGDITRTIYTDVINTFLMLIFFISIITECVICFIVLMFLLYVNFYISLFVGVTLFVELMVINKIIKPVLAKNGKINLVNSGNFFSNIIQSIESIKEIKVFGKEKYFIKKNEKYAITLSKTDCMNANYSATPKLLIEACTFSSISFLMAYSTIIGVDVKSLIPSVSAFAVAAAKLLPSINKIGTHLSSISYYTSSLDNVYNIVHNNSINSGNEIVHMHEKIINNNKMEFNEHIVFANVCFKYDDSDKLIFDNVDLKIPINKSVGIVGGSGEGKTTLVDLLTGLLTPTSGNILCDGADISSNRNGWLSLIGYIPQNTTLINDTIRANVAFGIDENDINDELIMKSLADAQIDDYVMSTKDKLDTIIGERGVKLSGGQRQRIGIARALYKNPKILILDEATSALDYETEKEVMMSINSLMNKKTIIIIAHRLSTLQNCDIVYKVAGGKVYEEKIQF